MIISWVVVAPGIRAFVWEFCNCFRHFLCVCSCKALKDGGSWVNLGSQGRRLLRHHGVSVLVSRQRTAKFSWMIQSHSSLLHPSWLPGTVKPIPSVFAVVLSHILPMCNISRVICKSHYFSVYIGPSLFPGKKSVKDQSWANTVWSMRSWPPAGAQMQVILPSLGSLCCQAGWVHYCV